MSEPITFVAKIQPDTERAWELFDPKQWYVIQYDGGIFNVYTMIDDPEVVSPKKRNEPPDLDLLGDLT